MRFKNRLDAGQKLAEKIQDIHIENPYVFGVARGGVPVAYEVSEKLHAPLDVVVTRKLGLPFFQELGFGAIAPNNIVVVNAVMTKAYGLTLAQIELVKVKEEREMLRRIERYRGSLEMPDLKDKTVIIVDDGLATGITMIAALRYLRTFFPKFLVCAVPVCSSEAAHKVKLECDEFITLSIPGFFQSVGEWYEEFGQVSDEEVMGILKESR